VVLHHIAQSTRLFVVAGARAHALLFRDRDLDVVHVLLVEQRLEDAVREAHHQDVLNGFLAQVVIDPVDLPFVEDLRQCVVDRARAVQIVADRFFDDQPCERPVAAGALACDEAALVQLFHRRREE
jgi:hypothetical protein